MAKSTKQAAQTETESTPVAPIETPAAPVVAETTPPEPQVEIETKLEIEETPGDCVIAAQVSEHLVVFATREGAANELRNAQLFTRSAGAERLRQFRKTYPNASVVPVAALQ